MNHECLLNEEQTKCDYCIFYDYYGDKELGLDCRAFRKYAPKSEMEL